MVAGFIWCNTLAKSKERPAQMSSDCNRKSVEIFAALLISALL